MASWPPYGPSGSEDMAPLWLGLGSRHSQSPFVLQKAIQRFLRSSILVCAFTCSRMHFLIKLWIHSLLHHCNTSFNTEVPLAHTQPEVSSVPANVPAWLVLAPCPPQASHPGASFRTSPSSWGWVGWGNSLELGPAFCSAPCTPFLSRNPP